MTTKNLGNETRVIVVERKNREAAKPILPCSHRQIKYRVRSSERRIFNDPRTVSSNFPLKLVIVRREWEIATDLRLLFLFFAGTLLAFLANFLAQDGSVIPGKTQFRI